jgi:pimeloyl-ACP methyl ester carboxylesterase
LHTSQNGRQLSDQLGNLLAHWPVPVEELTIIGYSMGGLITRSACHYAQAEAKKWLGKLKNIVFLASPHHGSPLERAGNLLDVLMGVTPYSAPYGKLFKLRSAGITDLRYGHVLDSDWEGHDRFRRKPDSRQHVPLPEGVRCFALAATLAAKRGTLADRLTGDGLVPLHSALGQHDDPTHTLKFDKKNQAIFHQMNHMEVPGRPEVRAQVLAWLTPSSHA